MSNPAPLRIAVLASGRGSNLQALMDAISAGKLSAEIGLVISNKKDAPALERAKAQGITTFFLDPREHPNRSDYDGVLRDRLVDSDVGLVVLAGYMRLLTASFFGPYHGRIINTHPSLLPAFPGLHAQQQALDYGVKQSGCTIHFVDEKMDHGPIIAQVVVPVLAGDTESTLSDRILVEEHRIFPEVIQWYAEGRLKIEGRKVRLS